MLTTGVGGTHARPGPEAWDTGCTRRCMPHRGPVQAAHLPLLRISSAHHPPPATHADLNFLYLSSRFLEFLQPDLARTSLSGGWVGGGCYCCCAGHVRWAWCAWHMPFAHHRDPVPAPNPCPQLWWATFVPPCWRKSIFARRRSTWRSLQTTWNAGGCAGWPPAPLCTASSPRSGGCGVWGVGGVCVGWGVWGGRGIG